MAAAVAVAAIMHKLNSHANLKSKKNWKAIFLLMAAAWKCVPIRKERGIFITV